MTARKYTVTDKSGTVINEGDTITSFRGEEWKFLMVTRGPEYNGTALVFVEQGPARREFYATVFNLTVTED